jgi:hypothetical protein
MRKGGNSSGNVVLRRMGITAAPLLAGKQALTTMNIRG